MFGISFLLTVPVSSSSVAPSEFSAVSERGRTLAEYGRAIGYACRALDKDGNCAERRFRLHIGRKTPSGWTVGFGRLTDKRDEFLVSYEVVQRVAPEESDIHEYNPPLKDSEYYLFAARAVETAVADFGTKPLPFDAAVIPAGLGQLYVYLTPKQTARGVYIWGDDARYTVSGDGSLIVDRHQMHESILKFGDPSPQKRPAAGFHSHVLSDVPEDTDVTYVLNRKPTLPEFVRTKNHLYEVETDGTIVVKK